MGLPPQLESDVQRLREQGLEVTVKREPPGGNRVYVLLDNYPLPPGWNRGKTDLLIISDVSYPYSALDMFWVKPDLKLSDGRIPQAADTTEDHLGQRWQRFSWHVQKWTPGIDNLMSYLGTIDARLRRLE